MTQKQIAQRDMVNWLSHPGELGKEPAEIELAKTFELNQMSYYIFKFKKEKNDKKWLLGVCGGYVPGSEQHSGHIFSAFKEYQKETALEDSIAEVNFIGDYWKSKAKNFTEKSVSVPPYKKLLKFFGINL